MKGVEIRVLARRDRAALPGTLRAYYKNDVATREAKDPEGWYHTGDAGLSTPAGT